MTWVIVLSVIFWLIVCFCVALEFQKAASDKGYEGNKYFWLSFLFGAVGWALVIALPNKKLVAAQEAISKKLDRQIELLKAAPCPPPPPEEAKKAEEARKTQEAKRAEKAKKFEEAKAAEKPKIVDGHGQDVTPLRGEKEDKIVCPICNQVQNAGRRVCMNCGARFTEPEE